MYRKCYIIWTISELYFCEKKMNEKKIQMICFRLNSQDYKISKVFWPAIVSLVFLVNYVWHGFEKLTSCSMVCPGLSTPDSCWVIFFYIYLLVWMPMSLLKCKSIVYGVLLQNYTKVFKKKLFLQNRFFGGNVHWSRYWLSLLCKVIVKFGTNFVELPILHIQLVIVKT